MTIAQVPHRTGLKVTVDNEEPIEDVVSWSVPGGHILLLQFKDGSHRGITGFVEFTIEPVKE